MQAVHVVPVVVGLAVLLELDGLEPGMPGTCYPGSAISYFLLSYFSCIMLYSNALYSYPVFYSSYYYFQFILSLCAYINSICTVEVEISSPILKLYFFLFYSNLVF